MYNQKFWGFLVYDGNHRCGKFAKQFCTDKAVENWIQRMTEMVRKDGVEGCELWIYDKKELRTWYQDPMPEPIRIVKIEL